MHLICRTTADSGFYGFAWLNLTPELAQQLPSYRPVFAQVRSHNDRLYCLEFFDHAVDYGGDFKDAKAAAGRDFEEGWWEVAGDPGLTGGWPTCAETMKVTDDGILWAAAPKHGGDYFETRLLTWEDLEAAARGEHPFGLQEEDRVA